MTNPVPIELLALIPKRGHARAIFTFLWSISDCKTGRCYPSVATIAGAVGASDRRVQSGIMRLAGLGLIERTIRYNADYKSRLPGWWRNRTNVYTVLHRRWLPTSSWKQLQSFFRRETSNCHPNLSKFPQPFTFLVKRYWERLSDIFALNSKARAEEPQRVESPPASPVRSVEKFQSAEGAAYGFQVSKTTSEKVLDAGASSPSSAPPPSPFDPFEEALVDDFPDPIVEFPIVELPDVRPVIAALATTGGSE